MVWKVCGCKLVYLDVENAEHRVKRTYALRFMASRMFNDVNLPEIGRVNTKIFKG